MQPANLRKQNARKSFLARVADLFTGSVQPSPRTRRLRLETLEGRSMLTVSAVADDYSVLHDQPLSGYSVLSNDFDSECMMLSASLVSGPSAGTVTLDSNGTFNYVPNAGYVGSDSFTYEASNGTNSAQATAYINVTNNAPVADDDSANVVHDQYLSDNVSALDMDADMLTFSTVSGPSHGTLNLFTGGAFTYTPTPGYTGSDSFTFSATDGIAADTGTFTINVTNNAPVADDDSANVVHDQYLSDNVNALDMDADMLAFSTVTGPAHGTVNLMAGGAFTYTPTPGYAGSDSFTFSATDGIATDTGTFTINVTNNAPVANDGSGSVYRNDYLSGNTTASDLDGDMLTYSIVAHPAHGTLNLSTAGAFTYTPTIGYIGPDAFTFSAADGIASDSGTYEIAVTCPPAAGPGFGTSSIAEGTAVGTAIYTVVPPLGGTYAYSISGGNANGYFAIDSNGVVTVNSAILVDADELHSLVIAASDGCGPYNFTLDVTVLPVLIDVYPAEEDDLFGFQFDHYVGSPTNLDNYWVLPARYVVEVVLPTIASPSDYEIELWDGTVLSLTSTSQQYEVTFVPPVEGGAVNLSAAVVLASDPTVQVADDNEPDQFSKWTKEINGQVKTWIGNLAESGFDSQLKDKLKDPFDAVKSEVNIAIGQLDPVTDATKISTLVDFRDNQLPGLHDQMVSKVRSLVLDSFIHTGNATVRNASDAKQALDDIGGIDTSLATDKILDIDAVVKFQISQDTKNALLLGDTTLLADDLKKPYKLFSEVGVEVKYVFDTESTLSGRLTVSNLDADPEKCTYKGSLNIFNVEVGNNRVILGVSGEYTPETDQHQAAFQLQIER